MKLAIILACFCISVTLGAVKRNMPGGTTDVDVNKIDPAITQFALNTLETGSNNYYARKIITIKDAKVQTVAGSLYTFTMVLGKTGCAKPQADKLTDIKPLDEKKCKVSEGSPTESCVVTVWSKPWEKFMKVTKTECSNGSNGNREEDAAVTAKEFTPGQVKIEQEETGGDNQVPKGQSEMIVDLLTGEEEHKITKKILSGAEEGEKMVKQKMRQLLQDERSVRELRELQSHSNFKNFVKRFERSYRTKQEYKRRYAVFRENMKLIQFLRETEQGSGIYGVTQFADYTDEEKKRFLGFRPDMHLPGSLPKMEDSDYSDFTDLPEAFDWSEQGAVTPVKNQGQCGSCWAFSVTGNIEGMWKIKTGQLVSLSEQELVDCDKTDHGCNGGLPSNAYQQIVKLGGLETEEEYKYDGADEQCKFNKSEVAVTISGGLELSKDESVLQAWLVKNGPISIGINANAMMFYMGGISHPWKFLCRSSSIDHGVLIVGYGVSKLPGLKDQPFWRIKNSWGESWGESGYYRIWRGEGTCGVNEMATSAVV